MRYQTRPARIQFFYFVVALALLANVCVPAFLSDAWPRNIARFLGVMAGGALCAEVCLLAIWAALGPQPIIYRMPLAFSLLVVAICAFLVGLQMRDQPQTLELDSAVGLAIVAVVMFTAVQIPFLFVRARDHKRIASPDTRFLTPAEESLQFGLRYLLGWMTGVGLLLVLVRYSVPGTVDRPILQLIPVMLIGSLVYGLISALICLPCVRLALSVRPSRSSLTWLVGVLLVGPPGVVAVIGLTSSWPPRIAETIAIFYSFFFGLAFTILLVLFGMRRLGFRLVSDERLWPHFPR